MGFSSRKLRSGCDWQILAAPRAGRNMRSMETSNVRPLRDVASTAPTGSRRMRAVLLAQQQRVEQIQLVGRHEVPIVEHRMELQRVWLTDRRRPRERLVPRYRRHDRIAGLQRLAHRTEPGIGFAHLKRHTLSRFAGAQELEI